MRLSQSLAAGHNNYEVLCKFQVSSLFQNQEDLLSEFSQFLPEATAYTASLNLGAPISKKPVQTSGLGKSSKGTRKVGVVACSVGVVFNRMLCWPLVSCRPLRVVATLLLLVTERSRRTQRKTY